MLVLSRKAGQSLIIGGDILLKVIEIRGQQVRIGVEAPAHITVVRQELHDSVVRENQAAARTEAEPEPEPEKKRTPRRRRTARGE